MANYRKIYEHHYGLIPKEDNGRSYEIHHIDGNRENNSPENLMAISIQEHLEIHKSQGDWAACNRIAAKMKLSPTEISEFAAKASQERVFNRTHNFLGGEIQKQSGQKRVENGTHPFLGGEIQGKASRQRVDNGTHNLLGENNPNKIKITCPYCLATGGKTNMKRWHFDNCKLKF